MREQLFDLAIVGGGVNGCAIARDAAGRGLSVLLVEEGDLARATSSASTKLLHGGLRYLEYYEFRLVREALIEREVLLRAAPHFIWPLRFVLPWRPGTRARWLVRFGLLLYDHLGGREILPACRSLDLTRDVAGRPLQADVRYGFEYSDCWVEDARLTIMNARDAADRGALVRPRTRCVGARRAEGLWRLVVEDRTTGTRTEAAARILVNATGPWADRFLREVVGTSPPARVRLVQGSHLVTRRLFDHDRAYLLQNPDGRIVFAIPYEQDFALIGTTDHEIAGDPGQVAVTAEERDYLLASITRWFRRPLGPEDIVWSYAGVRPLYNDGASAAQAATRDYVLHLDAPVGAAPLLSVFGGKLTTARKLAEAALLELAPFVSSAVGPWTASAHLPGGDFPWDGFAHLVAELRRRYPFLPERLANRLARYYGTRAALLLGDAKRLGDLGTSFGADLYEREVEWMRREEWAATAEDVLWRRSKLGLRVSAAEIRRLEAHLAGERRRPSIDAASPTC
ncbi:MAG: glycerol-3-phosphate dehydrogenase [Geminicoccaceae bacterium]|nr:glycerol-3-phosphate dehydrogenase [Geminicoccaceae bacterium]